MSQRDPELLRIGAGIVIAGQAMVFGLGMNMTPPDGTVRWVLHGILIASTLAVLLLLGRPLLENTLESIHDRELSVEMLFVASLLGAFAASLLNTFTGTGYVFYEVVAIVLVIYTFGRRLRARTRQKALAALTAAQERYASAWVESADGSEERLPVERIAVGATVRVRTGDPVPMDGVVLDERLYLDESSLTGEPLPVVRRAGDPVRSGCTPVDAPLRLRVTAPAGQREIDRLFRALAEARLAPSGFQRMADRLTGWFLPTVLAISATTFAWWCWQVDWKIAVFHSMAVLLVACPCALGMATPVAVWSGLARLAELGFAAKGGDFLDGLSRVDHVCFDKTGTLTETTAAVADFLVVPAWSARRAWLRRAAAEAERGLPHPLAMAIVGDYAGSNDGWGVDTRGLAAGRGVSASVRDAEGTRSEVQLGEPDWVAGARSQEAEELRRRLGETGSGRIVWLSADGSLAGAFLIRERVRDDVVQTARELGALGIACEVLTGDPEAPAELAGMPVKRGLSAEQKRARVAELGTAGRGVLVVGDGLNDSPAMAAALTSLAIEGGSGLTTGSAAAVVASGRLANLAKAIDLARSVRAGIRGNLLFAALYNLFGVALAASGLLHPLVAALLMLVSSAIVAHRALRSTRKK